MPDHIPFPSAWGLLERSGNGRPMRRPLTCRRTLGSPATVRGTLAAGAAGVPVSRATMSPMRQPPAPSRRPFVALVTVLAMALAACGTTVTPTPAPSTAAGSTGTPTPTDAPSLTPVPGGASSAPEPCRPASAPPRPSGARSSTTSRRRSRPIPTRSLPSCPRSRRRRVRCPPTRRPSPPGIATRSRRAGYAVELSDPAEDGSQVLDAQADLPECRIQMTFRPEDGIDDDDHPGRLRLRERHRLTRPRGERHMAAEAGRLPGRGPAGPGPGRARRAPRRRRHLTPAPRLPAGLHAPGSMRMFPVDSATHGAATPSMLARTGRESGHQPGVQCGAVCSTARSRGARPRRRRVPRVVRGVGHARNVRDPLTLPPRVPDPACRCCLASARRRFSRTPVPNARCRRPGPGRRARASSAPRP